MNSYLCWYSAGWKSTENPMYPCSCCHPICSSSNNPAFISELAKTTQACQKLIRWILHPRTVFHNGSRWHRDLKITNENISPIPLSKNPLFKLLFKYNTWSIRVAENFCQKSKFMKHLCQDQWTKFKETLTLLHNIYLCLSNI